MNATGIGPPLDREEAAAASGPLTRAAEYVRMSTEHQQYSTENQKDAIRGYAQARGMAIVRNYVDAGKSGLRLDGSTLNPLQVVRDFTARRIGPAQRFSPVRHRARRSAPFSRPGRGLRRSLEANLEWVPSHSGFLVDAPQRHSQTLSFVDRTLPSVSRSSIGPVTR